MYIEKILHLGPFYALFDNFQKITLSPLCIYVFCGSQTSKKPKKQIKQSYQGITKNNFIKKLVS